MLPDVTEVASLLWTKDNEICDNTVRLLSAYVPMDIRTEFVNDVKSMISELQRKKVNRLEIAKLVLHHTSNPDDNSVEITNIPPQFNPMLASMTSTLDELREQSRLQAKHSEKITNFYEYGSRSFYRRNFLTFSCYILISWLILLFTIYSIFFHTSTEQISPAAMKSIDDNLGNLNERTLAIARILDDFILENPQLNSRLFSHWLDDQIQLPIQTVHKGAEIAPPPTGKADVDISLLRMNAADQSKIAIYWTEGRLGQSVNYKIVRPGSTLSIKPDSYIRIYLERYPDQANSEPFADLVSRNEDAVLLLRAH